MQSFYELIDLIKNILNDSSYVNKVTFGDITEVDLGKLTNFPLSHITVDQVRVMESTFEFELRIICCDVVDVVKSDIVSDDEYYGNNNIQDILNTQLTVVTEMANALMRMDILDTNYTRLDEGVIAVPFLDRFENELAGWEVTIVIRKKNDGGTSSNGFTDINSDC